MINVHRLARSGRNIFPAEEHALFTGPDDAGIARKWRASDEMQKRVEIEPIFVSNKRGDTPRGLKMRPSSIR
jgi:hypothetical protein